MDESSVISFVVINSLHILLCVNIYNNPSLSSLSKQSKMQFKMVKNLQAFLAKKSRLQKVERTVLLKYLKNLGKLENNLLGYQNNL